MQIAIITLTGFLLIVLFSGCDVFDTSPDPLGDELREVLHKSPGESITTAELATLTQLTLSLFLWEMPTTGEKLAALAECINLTELDLIVQGDVDVSPLAKLNKSTKKVYPSV